MVLPARKYYTPQEYLTLEEAAAYKSEYYKGEIFQMAGGTFEHNSISANMIGVFKNKLRGRGCHTLTSDQRVHIVQHNHYTYPDASVVCGPPEHPPSQTNSVVNPVVIVEVLSDSTALYDHTAKFAFYRSIPTLQTYIMIDQYQVLVEVYQKAQENQWLYSAFNSLGDTVSLSAPDVSFVVADLYEDITFQPHQTMPHEN